MAITNPDEVYRETEVSLVAGMGSYKHKHEALDRWHEHIEASVIPNPGISWDNDTQRQFILKAARDVGAIAAIAASVANNAVVGSHIDEAFRFLVPFWEPVCPLPALKPLMTDCFRLRQRLGMPIPAAAEA